MVKQDFIAWLEQELAERSWTRAELSRRANVSQSMLSMIWSGDRQPGNDLCEAVARALGYASPETVFRAAGLLPALPPEDAEREAFMAKYMALTPANRERFRRIVETELLFQREQEAQDRQALERARAKKRSKTGPLPKLGE